MPHKKSKRRLKHGLPPGSLVFTGDQKMEKASIHAFFYDSDQYREQRYSSIDKALEEARSLKEGVAWINISGLHDTALIDQAGKALNLHKLSVEDILNVEQRPKLETADDHVYAVLKMFQPGAAAGSIDEEQISFGMSDGLLISFQEKEGDVFDPVRRRIREGKGSLRRKGSDYLLYALIDAIVDHYFLILENLGERIDQAEDLLLRIQNEKILARLHGLRREVFLLRRSVYPLRELISQFERLDEPHLQHETRVFVRDLHDHSIQVIENLELMRESCSGMLDLYMNLQSNRMNKVMKVLTIIATLFIPLTFIAGVYGMNFEYMPELGWRWAYFAVLGLMLLLAAGMLWWFRRRGWL